MINSNDNEHYCLQQYEKAKNYAFRLLAVRDRTQYEIADKLKQRDYSQPVIDLVIETLQRLGYINDSNFAKEYIRQKTEIKHLGRTALTYKLRKLGVEDKIIAEQLSDYTREQEYMYALLTAEKYLSVVKTGDTRAKKRKLIALLQRKGFDFDIIRMVLEDVNVKVFLTEKT